MAWLALAIAGLLEVVWAVSLKQSAGFSNLLSGALAVGGAIASFVMLGFSLQHLALATAYTIWVGIGAGGVAIAGALLFGEPITLARSIFLMMVLSGVIGLNITS